MTPRERLRDLLRSRSLMFGDFVLASGQRSRYYFDSKRTTLTAEGASLVAREILSLIEERGLEADAIGGMTLGADPIVSAVAALSFGTSRPIDAFIVRKEPKEHGTARPIEGQLHPQARVIVVDDVVTTGGSTLKALEAVEAAGHRVVAVICLVDREEGGGERLAARWPFYPLYTRGEIFSESEEGQPR